MITRDLLKKLEQKSSFSFSNEGENDIIKDLSKVLNWIEKLSEVNTLNSSSCFKNIQDSYSVNDQVNNNNNYQEINNTLSTVNRDLTKDGFFIVPKVIK
jgi:aspartyl/glutamyl-tRNA(Asn/Gln) amidotransferase C subunit